MSAVQTGEATFPALPRETGSKDIFPREIVEGMLAMAVREVKFAMDDIYESLGGLDQDERVEGNYLAIGLESASVVDMLSAYHDAALSPKHRAARALFVELCRRLEANDLRDDKSGEAMARFAVDMVTFLEAVHMCLLEGTDRKKRYYWKKRFLDG